jgi:hypothetical protein
VRCSSSFHEAHANTFLLACSQAQLGNFDHSYPSSETMKTVVVHQSDGNTIHRQAARNERSTVPGHGLVARTDCTGAVGATRGSSNAPKPSLGSSSYLGHLPDSPSGQLRWDALIHGCFPVDDAETAFKIRIARAWLHMPIPLFRDTRAAASSASDTPHAPRLRSPPSPGRFNGNTQSTHQ